MAESGQKGLALTFGNVVPSPSEPEKEWRGQLASSFSLRGCLRCSD